MLVTSVNESLKTGDEAVVGMAAVGHPLHLGDIISERLHMAVSGSKQLHQVDFRFSAQSRHWGWGGSILSGLSL